ncbi:hypothetical protein RI367_000423 [Sorochytrium milnesiophthora]
MNKSEAVAEYANITRCQHGGDCYRLGFKSCNKSEQYRNFMSASAEMSQASSSRGNANAKFKRVQFQEAELQSYQPSSLKYYFVPFSDYADPEEQQQLPAYSADGSLAPSQLINPVPSLSLNYPPKGTPDVDFTGFHVADIRIVLEEIPGTNAVLHHIHYISPPASPLQTNERLRRVFVRNLLKYASTHHSFTTSVKTFITRAAITIVLYVPGANRMQRRILDSLEVPSQQSSSSPYVKYTVSPQKTSEIVAMVHLPQTYRPPPQSDPNGHSDNMYPSSEWTFIESVWAFYAIVIVATILLQAWRNRQALRAATPHYDLQLPASYQYSAQPPLKPAPHRTPNSHRCYQTRNAPPLAYQHGLATPASTVQPVLSPAALLD